MEEKGSYSLYVGNGPVYSMWDASPYSFLTGTWHSYWWYCSPAMTKIPPASILH